MESIDKLRECVDKQREEYNNHNVSFVWQLSTIADEIEAEIADRFIELPTDADGAPWTFETESFVDDTGIEVVFSGLKVDHKGRWKILSNCVWHDPSLCSHVKPRTLEDVLIEYRLEAYNLYADQELTGEERVDEFQKLDAEYDSKIRELLGFEIDEPDTIRNELEDNGLLGGEECEPTEEYTCNVCGQDLVACDIGVGANGGAIELDPPILFNYCPNCGKAVKR